MAPPRRWRQRRDSTRSETTRLLDSSTAEFDMASPSPKDASVVSEQYKQYGVTSSEASDGDNVKENPFLDPDVAEHWRLTYAKAQYECRHVFDPTLTWSEDEEKRIVRRLDWRICLWAVRTCIAVSSKC
jgi:hypothetical protein